MTHAGRTPPSRERVPEPEAERSAAPSARPSTSRAPRRSPNGTEPVGVEEPDAEEQERDGERHRMNRSRRRSSRPTGRRGMPSARSAGQPLGPEVPPPEPEDGKRPERHARRSARARAQAARATRSTAAPAARAADRRAYPSRTTCSPVEPSVISSRRPCVVLQTACTMFPRSKRPSRKFAYAPRTIANRATVHTSAAPQIASDHAWSRIAADDARLRARSAERPLGRAHASALRKTSTPSSSNTFTQAGVVPNPRRRTHRSVSGIRLPAEPPGDPRVVRVHDDPLRATHDGNAVEVLPLGEVRAEPVRRAGRRSLGHERDGAPKRVHPLGRHIGPVRRDRAPRRAGPRAEDDSERHAQRQYEHHAASPPGCGEPPEPEHRGRERGTERCRRCSARADPWSPESRRAASQRAAAAPRPPARAPGGTGRRAESPASRRRRSPRRA